MATSGAQPGNQNAAKGRDWRDAIRRATARFGQADYRAGLDKLADEFVKAVAAGDLNAFKEYGDRIDGKSPQAIIGGDDDDPAVKVDCIAVRLVKPDGA